MRGIGKSRRRRGREDFIMRRILGMKWFSSAG
jgi:hypothetical protein